jgi:hypothetical protein
MDLKRIHATQYLLQAADNNMSHFLNIRSLTVG